MILLAHYAQHIPPTSTPSGERLMAAAISTLDDLEPLQGDLLRELATRHTRLCVPTSDSNRTRWPLHPLWQALQAHVETLPQTGHVRSTVPLQY